MPALTANVMVHYSGWNSRSSRLKTIEIDPETNERFGIIKYKERYGHLDTEYDAQFKFDLIFGNEIGADDHSLDPVKNLDFDDPATDIVLVKYRAKLMTNLLLQIKKDQEKLLRDIG